MQPQQKDSLEEKLASFFTKGDKSDLHSQLSSWVSQNFSLAQVSSQ
jgi:hypothetical protein